MPNHFFIREAQVHDANSILGLVKELAVYEKEPEAVTVTLSEFEEHGWGLKPLFKSWVAIAEGEIVGMTLCYDRYSTWKGPVLYLEDFYVKPKARGTGIGKELFETCLNYAKQHNYVKMCWQVLEWNELALNFYKKYEADMDAEWLNGSINFK